MILAILAIWFGYKKAKATGRNPFLWAFYSGVTFIGLQAVTALMLTTVVAVGVEGFGWDEGLYQRLEWVITLVAVAISCLGLFLLFRYLDRVPDEGDPGEPPPPPVFGSGN